MNVREVNVLEVLRNVNVAKLNCIEAAIFEADRSLRKQGIFRVDVLKVRIKHGRLGGEQFFAVGTATVNHTVWDLRDARLDLGWELNGGIVEALYHV